MRSLRLDLRLPLLENNGLFGIDVSDKQHQRDLPKRAEEQPSDWTWYLSLLHGMEDQTTQFTLYVWPGQWGLPSYEPLCLAAIMYLQTALPGQFNVAECNNPDISPSGGWVSNSFQRFQTLQFESRDRATAFSGPWQAYRHLASVNHQTCSRFEEAISAVRLGRSFDTFRMVTEKCLGFSY
jgi:hypothetical protein